ncbi:hypothetical protein QWJ34_23990 [Saccharibacillus sp. CPCC 101409]|uniref:hypothetical protein n=1 Tax=Saccharibacillus sp. CPCC 101409 TaxID=3058041 RepID=UPI0026720905|nr:hypothetical protein [Saccharibacillus sp. CPCC 101409]MDO3412849.1 hypothetical protein [Saccharibacillus sp. CPCC 101409]
MKYITGIFAALLAVLLLFMYPLYEQARSQDKIAGAIVQGAATHFIDGARTKGYITPQMYEEFNAQLAATGNAYEVELEHLHKRYSPDYSDPANPATFQNSFTTFYDGFYSEQILGVLFPDNGRDKKDSGRRYEMQVGDYIGIELKNINRTAAAQLWDFLMNDNTQEHAAILMNYEGMVLNEDY